MEWGRCPESDSDSDVWRRCRSDAVAAVVEEDVSALDDVEISRADGGQQAVGATARARGDVDDVARRGQPALIQVPNVLRGVPELLRGGVRRAES